MNTRRLEEKRTDEDIPPHVEQVEKVEQVLQDGQGVQGDQGAQVPPEGDHVPNVEK